MMPAAAPRSSDSVWCHPLTSQKSRSEELNATVIIATRIALGNEASCLTAQPNDAARRLTPSL